jgi:hypothetical protein
VQFGVGALESSGMGLGQNGHDRWSVREPAYAKHHDGWATIYATRKGVGALPLEMTQLGGSTAPTRHDPAWWEQRSH